MQDFKYCHIITKCYLLVVCTCVCISARHLLRHVTWSILVVYSRKYLSYTLRVYVVDYWLASSVSS